MYRKKDSNECKEGNVESTFILIFVLSLEIFPEICKDRTMNRLAVLSSLHKSLIFIQNAYCVPPKNNFSKIMCCNWSRKTGLFFSKKLTTNFTSIWQYLAENPCNMVTSKLTAQSYIFISLRGLLIKNHLPHLNRTFL